MIGLLPKYVKIKSLQNFKILDNLKFWKICCVIHPKPKRKVGLKRKIPEVNLNHHYLPFTMLWWMPGQYALAIFRSIVSEIKKEIHYHTG